MKSAGESIKKEYCSPLVTTITLQTESSCLTASVEINNTLYFVDMKENDFSDLWL